MLTTRTTTISATVTSVVLAMSMTFPSLTTELPSNIYLTSGGERRPVLKRWCPLAEANENAGVWQTNLDLDGSDDDYGGGDVLGDD
ncbi:unnamed protein product [Soboliphyme baturini]|uniref:Secreted protein n=1 Tax=Soboliphyme baturini TaxID=241478 RepID=A0A183IEW9_9BILA|nr:unnamed protein product [Soboliphyme baturini]